MKEEIQSVALFVIKTLRDDDKVFVNVCGHDAVPLGTVFAAGESFREMPDKSGELSYAFDVVINPADIVDQQEVLLDLLFVGLLLPYTVTI